LKNVTLSIEKGKTTAIIGVNGSGKSTILKALGRLIKSDGQVIFDNQPLSQHSNREIARILALLPQSITAPADITVYELVSLGRPTSKINATTALKRRYFVHRRIDERNKDLGHSRK